MYYLPSDNPRFINIYSHFKRMIMRLKTVTLELLLAFIKFFDASGSCEAGQDIYR